MFLVYSEKYVPLQRIADMAQLVVHGLPKPGRRVRFPYSALKAMPFLNKHCLFVSFLLQVNHLIILRYHHFYIICISVLPV